MADENTAMPTNYVTVEITINLYLSGQTRPTSASSPHASTAKCARRRAWRTSILSASLSCGLNLAMSSRKPRRRVHPGQDRAANLSVLLDECSKKNENRLVNPSAHSLSLV